MSRLLQISAALLCLLMPPLTIQAETVNSAVQQGQDVMRGFTEPPPLDKQDLDAETKQKRQILFLMGSVLLISVFTTVGLGIAMALYNRPVFVAHMVFAGISATLALIHAIVAMVWFYPF
ncbi:MAG: hypothetical protein C4528_07500 [Gammaproteobacteria bacterium]|nr:MAG: hypothetical protein C4528_07500 [Gammaproteobacteria bacterium]